MKHWFAEEYPEERAEIFILDNGPTSEFQLPMSTEFLRLYGYKIREVCFNRGSQ